jgi:putative acetyltransferase
MKSIKRTIGNNTDFVALVKLLDEDLAVRDGEEHSFYHQYNGITDIKHAVLYYLENVPVACGAFKPYNKNTVEIKRMFVLPQHRNKGIAPLVLNELETWAKELHYTACILETGKKQPEAIRLYEKCNYKRVPNYAPYAGIENSVCMQKELIP